MTHAPSEKTPALLGLIALLALAFVGVVFA